MVSKKVNGILAIAKPTIKMAIPPTMGPIPLLTIEENMKHNVLTVSIAESTSQKAREKRQKAISQGRMSMPSWKTTKSPKPSHKVPNPRLIRDANTKSAMIYTSVVSHLDRIIFRRETDRVR